MIYKHEEQCGTVNTSNVLNTGYDGSVVSQTG